MVCRDRWQTWAGLPECDCQPRLSIRLSTIVMMMRKGNYLEAEDSLRWKNSFGEQRGVNWSATTWIKKRRKKFIRHHLSRTHLSTIICNTFTFICLHLDWRHRFWVSGTLFTNILKPSHYHMNMPSLYVRQGGSPCWDCWRRQHTWRPSGRRQHRSAQNGNPTRSRWEGRTSSPGQILISWWSLRLHHAPGWCCLSLGWCLPQ